MFFKQLKVATRIRLLIGLMLIGVFSIGFIALFQLQNNMLDDRKEKTKNLVEVGMSVLSYYHQLYQNGQLSEADAQLAARENLRHIRYDKNNYYFIFDTNYIYILYPSKPEFEGQNKRDLQDPNGKFLVQELVKAGQRGGDFVDYWFPRPGLTQNEPKLSYAALFTPWNWVIGTGVYIDDVSRAYWSAALLFGSIAGVLLVGLIFAGWLLGNSILAQLGGELAPAQLTMQQIAKGNLTVAFGEPPPDSLLQSLRTMIDALRNLILSINGEADSLVDDAEEIKLAFNEVSSAANQQAQATAAMAAAIDQLTISSSQISENARETESNSSDALVLASQGRERADQASRAIQKIAVTMTDASMQMRALEERTKQISSIANVIKGIAGQTNLLALNAAIEAARAGEQGRGFAVVADEVRKLASSTATATTEIEQMILGIQHDTGVAVEAMNRALPELEIGVTLANSASESLRAIEENTDQTLARIHAVADTTHEQAGASTAIAQHIDKIERMVSDTTSTIQMAAATAQRLETMALNLKQQIGRFRV
ncbi:methyl-accepting chemotaxis protein [Chromatium okenii]|jgi:methyl-accepting chemotaxis protein|uniref:Chemotaxis protein n=2 Tax=Chromatium okenii TaxID=61644 RepID=A0A2S7XTL5_9GAMM|nr:methyl-accepting chemotaxis protein [Chromatium okenii]PQJ97075.1 chemotaxis protein [Chromatium okenii]